MNYLSVCSGIEAASVAWKELGWEAVGFSEIEPFPCAVLEHRFPNVKNYGDMTGYEKWEIGTIDLLVGGTPCQSFSVAGLRQGLADPRGNLMLTFGAMASHFQARWIVWENVPGVLSSNGGRDFGSFLGMLAELGYGFAYRVLDAQFFGVPQRRRRVFVVGHLGDWIGPAKVLFDAESLSGNPPPRRDEGQGAAAYAEGSFGAYREGEVGTLKASGGALAGGSETLIAFNAQASVSQGFSAGGKSPALDASAVCYEHHGNDSRIREAGDTSPTITSRAGTGGNNLPILCLRERAGKPGGGKDPLVSNGVSLTLATGNDQAVCFQQNQRDEVRLVDGDGGVAGALQASPGMKQQNMLMVDRANGKWPADVAPTLNARFGEKLGLENQHIDQGAPMFVSGGTPMHIRRFTPRECERLQGFPDDWTKIPWKGKDAEDCPDSHRYKACGNSMAVPVMKWIGERINKQENDKTRKANRQHSLP